MMYDNVRNINVQVRLNEKEFEMLYILGNTLGLKKNDVIRKLIRDEYEKRGDDDA